MSEVKVNKISPRSGTGVQLGDSGDTITIPAGATINNQGTATNFGATGSASWNTTVKTSTFTAVAGEGYFVNTTGGVVTVNLPAGTAGAVVAVKDYAKTFDNNNLTIAPNGSEKIGGLANDAIISTEGIAITLIYIDSTQGWLVTDDGLQSSADNNPYMVATGGTITCSGNCRIHTFTGPGTFTVTKTANSAADNLVSYMVVAGGGGGGQGPSSVPENGGGGGAGGFREVVSPSSPYTGSPLNGYPTPGNRITVTATDFPIVVGGGGAGKSSPARGDSGSVSTFSTITSAGGGGGGTQSNSGLAGGSGGGGGTPSAGGGTGNSPPVSPAQGFNGGAGDPVGGGGGGGAAEVGDAAPGGGFGGFGGCGVTTSITGSSVGRGGGGAGGTCRGTPPSPVPFGGGASGIPATAGSDNTGGGGGASSPPRSNSAAGGSGIVVIRYKFQ